MKKLKQVVSHVCWAIVGVLIYAVLMAGIGRLWHH